MSTKVIALAFALGALSPLAGCSSNTTSVVAIEPEHVRIEPTAALYRIGDTVWVDLKNVGENDIAFNLCKANRERFESGQWVSAASLARN